MTSKRGVAVKGISNSQRRFWIGFITILLLSTAVIITESPTLTGAASIQIISFLKEGSDFSAEIRNVDNVKSFKTTILKDTKNSKIYFENKNSVSWNFQGKVISIFKISSEDEENFGSFEILLKIKEKDLQGIPVSELTLYHNGEALETTPGLKEDGFIYFTVRSNGFGEFLIGNIEKIQMVEEKPKSQIESQPTVIENVKDDPHIQEPKKLNFFQKFINSIKKFLKIN